MKKQKAIVIGGGFAGLSAASYLAKNGYQVSLFEKTKKLVVGLES
jgi:phytoene desaturase